MTLSKCKRQGRREAIGRLMFIEVFCELVFDEVPYRKSNKETGKAVQHVLVSH